MPTFEVEIQRVIMYKGKRRFDAESEEVLRKELLRPRVQGFLESEDKQEDREVIVSIRQVS